MIDAVALMGQLFSSPPDPDTEERMLREELARMMERHRAAAKPIVDRIIQLQARRPMVPPVIPTAIRKPQP